MTNTMNPFNEGSKIAEVFAMAAKGTTRDAINKFCEKNEVNAPRMFHCLRRQSYNDVKWVYFQDGPKVKLNNISAKGKAKPVASKKAAAPTRKPAVRVAAKKHAAAPAAVAA